MIRKYEETYEFMLMSTIQIRLSTLVAKNRTTLNVDNSIFSSSSIYTSYLACRLGGMVEYSFRRWYLHSIVCMHIFYKYPPIYSHS